MNTCFYNEKKFSLLFAIIFLCFAGIVSADISKFYNIDVEYNKGDLAIKGISVLPGEISGKYNELNQVYTARLVGFEGETLEEISFDAPLEILTDIFDPLTGEVVPETITLEKTNFNVRLHYFPNGKTIYFLDSSGKIINEIDVSSFADVCGDNICQPQESYAECSKDCPSGTEDNFCDGVKDNICDPDCIPIRDLDCTNPSWKFVWKNAYGEEIDSAQIGNNVKMTIKNFEPTPEEKIFEIFDYDFLLDNPIRTIENEDAITESEYNLATKELSAQWTITQEDYDVANDPLETFRGFYFKFNEAKSVNLEIVPLNADANYCSEYDEEYCKSCSDFSCNVAENTLNSLFETLEMNAVCGEKYGTGDYTTDCFCKWDVEKNKCGAGFRFIPSEGKEKIGECILSISSDDCADKFFEFSWNAKWNWHNDGKTDSLNVNEKCSDGKKTLPCPAQIQLPFFGLWQFIFSLLGIELIYFIFQKKLKSA
jgi:hypothetical protein